MYLDFQRCLGCDFDKMVTKNNEVAKCREVYDVSFVVHVIEI